MNNKAIARLGALVVSGLLGLTLLLGSWYTIDEGETGLVKRFGEITDQVHTGLHFKLPLIDSVIDIDLRERKNLEELSASTQNQLPITAAVSVNWRVKSEGAVALYREYGSIEVFEVNVLDPRIRSAAKAALAKYPADKLIKNRNAAVTEILNQLREATSELPIVVTSPQIENITLPERYMQAVLAKEAAREDSERQKHVLAKQAQTAQQIVNTATSNNEAAKLDADAAAYKITAEAAAEAEAVRILGEAEAAALTAKAEALKADQNLVQYELAKRWSGGVPTTVLSDTLPMLMNLGDVRK